MADFVCGRHTAEIWTRGKVDFIGDADPLLSVRWNRIRDDISHAEITLPTYQCCELLSELRTVKHELHIKRDGDDVWQGPITRLEFEPEVVQIFAEDMLWVAKKSAVEEGYNHSHPNTGNVIDVMYWLLHDQCFAKYLDPWRMTGEHGGSNWLFMIHQDDPANDPREARTVFPYSVSVWDDFDKFAEDYGADYTVVNRGIFFNDLHLAWKIIPPLDEEWISEFPRIVEYGNQLITRSIVTNGKGYAGMAVADDFWINDYGYIDNIITNVSESSVVEGPPSQEDVTTWMQTAQRNLDGFQPAPVAIVIPANTTLLPGSPWVISDLVPGAWFQVSVDRLCRTANEWQRLHEIVVEESAPQGERIQFTAIAAPGSMVIPA